MTETLRLKPFSTFAELSERDKQATAAGLTVAVNGAMKAPRYIIRGQLSVTVTLQLPLIT